jgi:hypothetical protein
VSARSRQLLGSALAAVVIGFAVVVWLATRPHPYKRGDVLAYLPQQCPAARAYVDVASLWTAVGSNELLTSARHGADLVALLAAFDAAGVDVTRDVRDFALCAVDLDKPGDARGSIYIAIGGSLGGTGALSRYKSIVETLSHVDANSIVEERRSGVPYLVSKFRLKRVWIAMPAADVLVFSTEDVARIDPLAAPHPVSLEAWQAQSDTTAAFEYASAAGTRIRGRMREEGGALVLDATAKSSALDALDVAKVETLRTATIAALDRSVLRALSGPVHDTALSLADGELRAELRVPGATLGAVLIAMERDPQVFQAFVAELVRRRGS